MNDERIIPDISDQHAEFWYNIAKRDDGHKRFHIPSVIFLVLDLTVFAINIATHASNRAYFGLALTILIHFASAWIISAFYKRNENAIDEDNVVVSVSEPGVWKWKLFRGACQALAITPLFRILANWRDHKENHDYARQQRIFRKTITLKEVQAIVSNKKRQCVKSYFDSLHAYFKTVPQCLLQVYLAMDINLPLRFCTFTDVTRVITLAWTIIAASKATASYAFALIDYLKSLEFQDYITYDSGLNLNPPKRHTFWITFFWNIISIGCRIYALSYILLYGGKWILPLVGLVFILNMAWMNLSPFSRPSYECPPSGLVSFCSDLVDRYINVFCFHNVRLSLKTVMWHQFLFIVCYLLILGTAIVQVYDLEKWEWVDVIEIVDHAYHEFHSKCNFTIFSDSMNGFARILNEILNSNGQDKSNFKDLFSNEIVLVVFFTISVLASFFYVTVYSTWAKLEDLGLPFQNSIKEWKVFLNQNWAETGPELTLKLVILGVADSVILELWKYKLPNDVQDLKAILGACMSSVPGYQEITAIRNDQQCTEFLTTLSQYLKNLELGEEAHRVVDYFLNYFPICMKQMTSYRIAQIRKIVQAHGQSEHICSRLVSILPFCQRRIKT